MNHTLNEVSSLAGAEQTMPLRTNFPDARQYQLFCPFAEYTGSSHRALIIL